MTRLELATSTVGGVSRGARPAQSSLGADDEARTRDIDLGKVALYQLSYIRMPANRRAGSYPTCRGRSDRLQGGPLGRDAVAGGPPGEAALDPRRRMTDGPVEVARLPAAERRTAQCPGGVGQVEVVGYAERVEHLDRDRTMAERAEVQPVLGPHQRGVLGPHPPRVEDDGAVPVGDLADPLVVDREPTAQPGERPTAARVEGREDPDRGAGGGELAEGLVVHARPSASTSSRGRIRSLPPA